MSSRAKKNSKPSPSTPTLKAFLTKNNLINEEVTPKKQRAIQFSDEEDSQLDKENKFPRSNTTERPMKVAKFESPSETKKNILSDDFKSKFSPSAKNLNTESDTKSIKQDLSNASLKIIKPSSEIGIDKVREGNFPHNNFKFLQPDHIKDKFMNPKDHLDYDSKTLFVPQNFIKSQTPTMQQWWKFKSDYFDTVLFFKLGKFYELLHMDADIGVKELDLIYMKSEYAHAGFPEISFPRYADILMRKGYKIARVEQIETPQAMNKRLKENRSSEKCIARGVCQVSSEETKTFNAVESSLCPDDSVKANSEHKFSEPKFLMALTVKNLEISSEKQIQFGISIVDTSSSSINIAQFYDDRFFSRFRTLVSNFSIGRIIYEKGSINSKLMNVFKNLNCNLTSLRKNVEFPANSSDSMKSIVKEKYFHDKNANFDASKLPTVLLSVLNNNEDFSDINCDHELSITSLGALKWYLKYCKIDFEIFSMKNFTIYNPIDLIQINSSGSAKNDDKVSYNPRNLILDSGALISLNIIPGKDDKESNGENLFDVINYCQTPFGQRLLKKWLTNPLAQLEEIKIRSDTISCLCKYASLDSLSNFTNLPDFDKMLSVVHHVSVKPKDHPDSKAVLFCEPTISKRKTSVFINLLNGFLMADSLIASMKQDECFLRNDFLLQILNSIPDFSEFILSIFKNFDLDQAKETGKIIPKPGFSDEFDEASKIIDEICCELEDYLNQEKEALKCDNISFGIATSRYHLEIPDKFSHNLSAKYTLTSQKKGIKRYMTNSLQKLIVKLEESEREIELITSSSVKLIFSKFLENINIWKKVTEVFANLDCLFSLAKFSRGDAYKHQLNYEMCKPEFCIDKLDLNRPWLNIKSSYHPQLLKVKTDLVENSIFMNCEEFDAPLMILTGPNMGGKSTIMRQVAQLVILAQMGCYVPAKEMKINVPFDRIFVRIGASDSLLTGQSTFMVELSETSSILRHATKNSLVLIDELGRGTSTYDGVSLARSVADDLASRVSCLTLFSTHYHDLVESLEKNKNICQGHMDCVVEDNKESNIQDITFLYKLIKGICPKSYGFNAARLAGLPDEIIESGMNVAEKIEVKTKAIKALTYILSNSTSASEKIAYFNVL